MRGLAHVCVSCFNVKICKYYTGYQRQLNYKDPYGAYSTFGRGAGNTW